MGETMKDLQQDEIDRLKEEISALRKELEALIFANEEGYVLSIESLKKDNESLRRSLSVAQEAFKEIISLHRKNQENHTGFLPCYDGFVEISKLALSQIEKKEKGRF
jgi:hypothetical protein